MTNNNRHLIVGGGIAGISLALHFVERQQDVLLISNRENYSSLIAAGIVNPLVFRRMTKSWRVDELIPYAIEYYTALEKKMRQKFFHEITIRRFFSSEQEKELWLKKQYSDEYNSYMHPVKDSDLNYHKAKNDFGSARLKQAFYIDTAQFIESTSDYIQGKHQLEYEMFDFSAFDAQSRTYKKEKFLSVTFCEGVGVKQNPLFDFVSVNATKGEILTIETDSLPQEELLNRKCFVLPLGNNRFKVGSTYVWHTNNVQITEEGRQQILQNLSYITDQNVRVVQQVAGVRPTTFDRRPIMGSHPTYNQIFIFNGLGTKGYMLSPLLGKEMVDHILDQKDLHAEVKIERLLKSI